MANQSLAVLALLLSTAALSDRGLVKAIQTRDSGEKESESLQDVPKE